MAKEKAQKAKTAGAGAIYITGYFDDRHPIKSSNLLYSAPHVALRGPIYMIFVILVAAFLYSFWGKKDTIVPCPLELTANFSTVQSPTAGIVRRVLISEGNRIGSFTTLIEIQYRTRATEEKSEQTALEERRKKLEREQQRHGKREKTLAERLRDLQKQLGALKERRELLKKKISIEEKEFEDSVREAEQSIKTIELEKEKLELDLDKAKETVKLKIMNLKVAEDEFKKDKKLYKDKLITKPDLNNSELKFQGAQTALSNAQNTVRQIKNSISQLEIKLTEARHKPNTLRRKKDKMIMQHQGEISGLQGEISKLTYDIRSSRDSSEEEKEKLLDELRDIEDDLRDAGQLLPGVIFEGGRCLVQTTFAGTVTKVLVKPGDQVSPGQPLFKVVKETEPLYARILVANKDIGYIRTEQRVKIKYFAFPYQEYGIQTGEISHISSAPSTNENEAGMYVVKVSLDKFNIRKKNGKPKPLTLGLQGMAEIKVGSKRLIELIFEPLSRFLSPQED